MRWQHAACVSSAPSCSRASAARRACPCTRAAMFPATVRRGIACRYRWARSRSANICTTAAARWRFPARRTCCPMRPAWPACTWTAVAKSVALLAAGGFAEIDRHDGHHPEPGGPYAAYLRANGYDCADPWSDFVISAVGPGGDIVSGWHMRNAGLAARVAERHSETAYTTDRALDFIRAQADRPWVLHLSYVKPHWPYIAPAPYHKRYSLEQCLPVVRDARELRSQHPVVAAYRQQEECANFARDEVWQTVRPTYQGLIQQIDDHLGRIWDALDALGRFEDTLIVFTADHGDFLGDHWLGEKELFYDTVQRVPLIVYDPDRAADATRGSVEVAVCRRCRSDADVPRCARRADRHGTHRGQFAVAADPRTPSGSLARFRRLRTRLRLSQGTPNARPRSQRLPRLDGSHRALEIRALAGLQAAIVRSRRRSARVRRSRRRRQP